MLVFIGGPEIILIVLVIVLFFGSKKIPEFAKAFARAMNEIKDASNEIRKEIKKSPEDINDTLKKWVRRFFIIIIPDNI